MAYADATYYKEIYVGNAIPDEELTRQLERASDQVDTMCYNRIATARFDLLTTFQQERIKKAVCAHADFTYQYGAYLDLPVSGYSAGSISLTFKVVAAAGGIKTSEKVRNLLSGTGLTNRRLDCYGR
mgnify:CR=1 FL=1